MADKSRIEWTDATWNPLRGCSRVSAGCQHCYAERVAARFCGAGQPYEGLIHPSTRGWNGQVRLVPEVLGQPWHWVKPRRVFVNSMSDLFHESVPFEFIAAVFWVMSVTTRHTYQILTKRPSRMVEFFRWVADYDGTFKDDRIGDVAMEHPAIKALGWTPARSGRGGYDNCGPGFPYENVWLGVSVENQATADERIPLLLECPAAVRWLSCEPLLGEVDLSRWLLPFKACGNCPCPDPEADRTGIDDCCRDPDLLKSQIDWVIAGGESGPGARPMHPDWARTLRDQCAAADVPFFFKQWGEWAPRGPESWGYPCVEGVPRIRLTDAGHNGNDGAAEGDNDCWMNRAGKRKAGRLLDGVEHNEYPAQTHS